MMTISRFQFFLLKYSRFIESMVLPMPFSSFKVGNSILIFVVYHSCRNQDMLNVVKRFY